MTSSPGADVETGQRGEERARAVGGGDAVAGAGQARRRPSRTGSPSGRRRGTTFRRAARPAGPSPRGHRRRASRERSAADRGPAQKGGLLGLGPEDRGAGGAPSRRRSEGRGGGGGARGRGHHEASSRDSLGHGQPSQKAAGLRLLGGRRRRRAPRGFSSPRTLSRARAEAHYLRGGRIESRASLALTATRWPLVRKYNVPSETAGVAIVTSSRVFVASSSNSGPARRT